MEVGRMGVSGYVSATPKKEKTQQPSTQTLGRSLVDAYEKNQRLQQERAQSAYGPDWIAEQLKNSDEQAKASAKELKVMLNCQKIAARIMAGDKVDPKDMQYLMEHDIKGFQLAMAMRKPKEKPEECERITEDEEDQVRESDSTSAESGGSVEEVAATPAQGGESTTA